MQGTLFLIRVIFDIDKSEKTENFHRNLGVTLFVKVVVVNFKIQLYSPMADHSINN